MNRFVLVVITGLQVALVSTALPAADRVDLASGEVLYGKILKLNESEVAIQLGAGGVVTFKRAHIRSVRRERVDKQDDDETHETTEAEKAPDQKPASNARSQGANRSTSDPPAVVPAVKVSSGKSPVSLPGEKPDLLVTLEQERVEFSPPRGFQQQTNTLPEGALAHYLDTATKASFLLARQTSSESVENAKKQMLHGYSKVFSNFSVVRNERLKNGDVEVSPEAWVLESAAEAAGQKIRQVQLFTKRGDELFVLTYAVPAQAHETVRPSIERSLSSFRFLEAAPELR